MEYKWFYIMLAVALTGMWLMISIGAYSDSQVKVAREQTLAKCYEAAKTNPNIKCEQLK